MHANVQDCQTQSRYCEPLTSARRNRRLFQSSKQQSTLLYYNRSATLWPNTENSENQIFLVGTTACLRPEKLLVT